MIGWLRRHVCVLVGVGFLLAAPPAPSFAEDVPKTTKRERKKHRSRASARRKERDASRTEAKPEPKPEAKSTNASNGTAGTSSAQEAARAKAQEAAEGVDSQIVKEGDTSVKVMSFSGLDIEGRLKSPQLLYFVNRMRAEFDRPKLPHRSFMPELDRSTRRDRLR